jgi:hypothetical protein
LNAKIIQTPKNLESPHIPRVPGVLQTVLVALQKELQEEPVDDHWITGSLVPVSAALLFTATTKNVPKCVKKFNFVLIRVKMFEV